jgi:hypothetical protein
MMVLDQRVDGNSQRNVIVIDQLDTDKIKQQLFEAFSLGS